MKAEELINKNNKSENFEGTEREAKTSSTKADAQNKNVIHTRPLVNAEQKVNELHIAQNNLQDNAGNAAKVGNAAGKVNKEGDFYSAYVLTEEDLYFQDDEVYGVAREQPAPETNMAAGNGLGNIDSGKLLVGGGIGLALLGGAIAMGGGGGGGSKGGGDVAPPSGKEAIDKVPTAPVLRDAQVNLKNKTLTAQADPGTKVFFYIKGEKIGEGTVDAKGNVSVNTDDIEDGSHAIYAVAKDAQGRQSQISETKNIVFDRVAPTITFEGHENGYINATDRDNKKPLVAYTEPNATVELFDSEKKLLGTQTADASGKVSFNADIITHGKKVFLKATDAGGNQVTSKELIADYEVGEIKSYGFQYVEANKAYISGLSGEADKETKKIKLQFAGQTQWQEAEVINGKWTFTFEPTIKNIGQGYKIVVEDAAGNASKTIEVNQLPAPVIRGYEGGFINAQNKKLTAVTNPNVDVEVVDAKTGQILATDKSDAKGAVVFDVTSFDGKDIFLQVKGSNTQQGMPSKTLKVDVTPPPADLVDFEMKENQSKKGFIEKISGQFAKLLDNGGKIINPGDAKSLEFSIDGKMYKIPVDANGKWSYEFKENPPLKWLVGKEYSIKAIDEVGNIGEALTKKIHGIDFAVDKISFNSNKNVTFEGTGVAGLLVNLKIIVPNTVVPSADGKDFVCDFGWGTVGDDGTFSKTLQWTTASQYQAVWDYLSKARYIPIVYEYYDAKNNSFLEYQQILDTQPPKPVQPILKDAPNNKTAFNDDVLTGPVDKLLPQKKSEEISPQKSNEAYEKNAEKNSAHFKSISEQDPLNDFI